MYCVNCGTPLTQGLSYCNRCGANLREKSEPSTGAISAFLTAITLVGIAGLGIMLGGALVLRRGADLSQEMIGFFMLFTFLIVGLHRGHAAQKSFETHWFFRSTKVFAATGTAGSAPAAGDAVW